MDYVSNEELIREARRRLNQGAWDYLVGGSESETTMRRNRLAFDRLGFRPRVLVEQAHDRPLPWGAILPQGRGSAEHQAEDRWDQ